jgi:hypothetical protein
MSYVLVRNGLQGRLLPLLRGEIERTMTIPPTGSVAFLSFECARRLGM